MHPVECDCVDCIVDRAAMAKRRRLIASAAAASRLAAVRARRQQRRYGGRTPRVADNRLTRCDRCAALLFQREAVTHECQAPSIDAYAGRRPGPVLW